MNDEQSQPSNPPTGAISRLAAGFSTGWRALSAAFARMTPSTPPISDAVRRNAETQRTKEDSH